MVHTVYTVEYFQAKSGLLFTQMMQKLFKCVISPVKMLCWTGVNVYKNYFFPKNALIFRVRKSILFSSFRWNKVE